MVRIVRVQDRRGFEIHGWFLGGLIIDHENGRENGMKSKKTECCPFEPFRTTLLSNELSILNS